VSEHVELLRVAWVDTDAGGRIHFADEFELRLRAERVGRTSVTYAWRIVRAGELCVVGRHTVVHVDGTGRPAALPDTLRGALTTTPSNGS
jgi:acyl-CoA thioesterase FadM